MTKHWLILFVAAIFEVLWVIGLKHAHDVWTRNGTLLAILISFCGLIEAGKKLPAGTAYAVFVGLGTAGTVIADIVLFGEPFRAEVVFLILVLLAGIVGLKFVTEEKDTERG